MCIAGHEWNNYREGTGKALGTFIVFLAKQHLWIHLYFHFHVLLESMRREQQCVTRSV